MVAGKEGGIAKGTNLLRWWKQPIVPTFIILN